MNEQVALSILNYVEIIAVSLVLVCARTLSGKVNKTTHQHILLIRVEHVFANANDTAGYEVTILPFLQENVARKKDSPFLLKALLAVPSLFNSRKSHMPSLTSWSHD